jgi:hypothetical protein
MKVPYVRFCTLKQCFRRKNLDNFGFQREALLQKKVPIISITKSEETNIAQVVNGRRADKISTVLCSKNRLKLRQALLKNSNNLKAMK